jgi:hypothetical protein
MEGSMTTTLGNVTLEESKSSRFIGENIDAMTLWISCGFQIWSDNIDPMILK